MFALRDAARNVELAAETASCALRLIMANPSHSAPFEFLVRRLHEFQEAKMAGKQAARAVAKLSIVSFHGKGGGDQ